MNRKQFLETLRTELNGLPDNFVEETIAYYDNYIKTAKTQKEAILELGTPVGVAKQVKYHVELNGIKHEEPVVEPTVSEPEKVVPIQKEKRKWETWQIVLLACLSPILLPLVLALSLVIFALCITVFSFLFAFLIVAIAFIMTGILLIPLSIFVFFYHIPTAIANMGLALVLIGLGVLMFPWIIRAFQAIINGLGALIRRLSHE